MDVLSEPGLNSCWYSLVVGWQPFPHRIQSRVQTLDICSTRHTVPLYHIYMIKCSTHTADFYSIITITIRWWFSVFFRSAFWSAFLIWVRCCEVSSVDGRYFKKRNAVGNISCSWWNVSLNRNKNVFSQSLLPVFHFLSSCLYGSWIGYF